jgi:GNAT superfamily N-acetyltransferase
MMIQIRAARPEDAAAILGFIRSLAEYEKLAEACVATEAQLAQTLFGERPWAEVLVAEFDGAPAGFALYFHNYSTFLAQPGLYLEDLFVEPGMRGKGIGKALLQRVAQVAVERGCGRMEWSVLDWNQPAIEFYRACGARPQDGWTTFRLAGEAMLEFAGG